MTVRSVENYNRAMQMLLECEEILPLARRLNQLDKWAQFYTEAYMLKLRTMP